jgi:hypothetical protein
MLPLRNVSVASHKVNHPKGYLRVHVCVPPLVGQDPLMSIRNPFVKVPESDGWCENGQCARKTAGRIAQVP